MTIRILGPFDVVKDGQTAPLGGSRQRAVLAMLALHPNRVVSVDTLADELWTGSPPPGAATTLRGYVHHLRRALEGTDATIETRRPGYQLVVEPERIDAFRFERLVDSARAASADAPQIAADQYRLALALWRGPVLADFAYEPFAQAEITRLEELRLIALEERIAVEMRLGRHGELVGELQALVATHPLREAFRGELMTALHATGRRAEALRVYQQGRQILAEELGLDPGVELQRLEQAILIEDTVVAPAGAAGAATPAARPSTMTGNLPSQVTSFLGREREVEQVSGLLRKSRPVTVTGAGGSGKTRLALAVAEATAGEHEDGAWLVELGTVAATHADVPAMIAAAVGVPLDSDRPVIDMLAAGLARRDMLLVLDNCEHVVAQAAEVVAQLLRHCEGLRVLATSRERLSLSGEVAWAIPTLPVPGEADSATLADLLRFESAQLFVERASAFPAFQVSDRDATAIAQICRRLDGIPLALELAAARLPMLSVEQIAARLDDRFKLLTKGGREAMPRHQTLLAAVDSSYELLNTAERLLFGRLAVFVTPFALEAAEVVGAGDGIDSSDVLDVLTALVEKSLVNRTDGADGWPRYRLLETIRVFAGERLAESDEEDAVRRRHVSAFTARVEEAVGELEGTDSGRWQTRLDSEHDDARSALAWAIDHEPAEASIRLAAGLWPYWNRRSAPAEGTTWLTRVLARPGGAPQWRLAALVGQAHLAALTDQPELAESAIDAGLSVAAEVTDGRRARAQLLITRSELRRHRTNDPDEAHRLAEEAGSIFAAVGDVVGEAHAFRMMTLLAWDRGELEQATALATRCHELFEKAGHLEGEAGTLAMLGGIARDRGDLDRATELYRQSLVIFQKGDEAWGTAHVVRSLGTLAVARGDFDLAYELGEESLRLHEELSNDRGVAESLLVMGDAALNRGEFEQAEILCTRALTRFRERGFSGDVCVALQSAARVALRRGSLERAAAFCEEALQPYRESGHKRDAAPALHLLSLVRARQGFARLAAELAEEAMELFREAGDERGVARSLEALAEAALVDSDFVRAARYLSAARTTRSVVGALTPAERPDVLRVIAAVWTGLGDTEFAREWAAEWGEDMAIDLRDLDGAATAEPVVSWRQLDAS